jgi:hypothetical protein
MSTVSSLYVVMELCVGFTQEYSLIRQTTQRREPFLKITKSEANDTRALIATIRQLGGCPCPRCLIPKSRLHNFSMTRDRQQRTTLQRSHGDQKQLVNTTRKLIYEKNYGVDSTGVENLLKPCSWVPTYVNDSVDSFSQANMSQEHLF